MEEKPSKIELYKEIISLLQSARKQVVKAVNTTMVLTYYEIGRMIVEEEQEGKNRAEYGKHLLKELSTVLTNEFGKGFSLTNIQQMRNFYNTYKKQQTLSVNLKLDFGLSWSHYLFLMRIDDTSERQFYEIESAKDNWSVRELKRQYDSALYTRLALSRDKEGIKKLAEAGLVLEKPQDAIKDPYILEFIGLPDNNSYSESELEQELENGFQRRL